MCPNFKIEQDLIRNGCSIIAGVDEVGRGPLAGPVTAAAVILNPLNIPDNLNDSKILSSKKREKLFEQLKSSSAFAVAHVSPEEIDKLNILQASLLAMVNAVSNLKVKPNHILISLRNLSISLQHSLAASISEALFKSLLNNLPSLENWGIAY